MTNFKIIISQRRRDAKNKIRNERIGMKNLKAIYKYLTAFLCDFAALREIFIQF